MDETLLEVIRELSEKKKAIGIYPTHVLKLEVYDAVKCSLNNLYRQGRIRVGDTLNDKWIVLTDKNEG